jgi:UDP-N-acetylglucosamine 3-dehydrogenase
MGRFRRLSPVSDIVQVRPIVTSQASTQPLRPAVVGGGMMGAVHVRALLSREDVPSLALVEPDAVRRELLERQYGRLRTYERLSDALASEELDFATVAVPVRAAAEAIGILLEARIPVLAEKPLAGSAADAHDLAQLADNQETLLSVGYIERFNPAVQALRDELEKGTAGAVYHVHARRLSPFPYRSGMAGVVFDVATHDLDVLSFLTRSVPVRVYAEADVRQGGGGEDLLCASLRYENGVTGLVEANWLTPTKVRRLTVTTERGMYDVDYLTQDLWLSEHASGDSEWEALGVMRGANEGRTIRFALDRREPLAIEHERFIEAVRTGGRAPVPASEAVQTLMVAEAILESSRTNQPVEPRMPAAH